MFVCLCRSINTEDLHTTLSARPETGLVGKNGVSSEFAEEIHMKCSDGLGYNCRSCEDTVKEVINSFYGVKKSNNRKKVDCLTKS